MKQRLLFILVFLVGLVVGLFYFVDFLHNQHPSISNTLNRTLLIYILGAVVIQLIAHITRAYKSKLLIDSIRKAKTTVLFKGLSIGFLFNTLLPLRLGELVRAFYTGDALAISKTAVFMSIIIERVIDGLILGVCFISANFLIRHTAFGASMTLTHIGLGLVVLSSILVLAIQAIRSESKFILHSINITTSVFNDNLANRLRFMAWSGIYGTKLMLADKKKVWRYFVLSVGMWILYFTSTAIVVIGFFRVIAVTKLWYLIQSTYAGVSAPAGPGYLGSFHLIVSNLLAKTGLERIGDFSLLIWLILTTPISLVGLVVLVKQRLSDKQDMPTQQMLINKLHREKDISEELAHFLASYFKGEKINKIFTQAELDNKFKLIKSFRGGSNAHTMLVWQDQGLKVKKITLVQYAEKLEAQANWLIERQHMKHIPKVVAQEKTKHYYAFDLDYGENFSPFFEFIHSNPSIVSYKVLDNVIGFMRLSIYEPIPVKNGTKKVKTYIDSKVIGKVNDAAKLNSTINQLLSYKQTVINNKTYPNILQVIKKIKSNKRAMTDLTHYHESVIHGDLTVDNLLVSPDRDFLVLDPNNENEVSAAVVDYAKMYQSLHSGYEFLIQLDNCTVIGNVINFEDSKSHKYAEIFKLFDSKLKKELDPSEHRTILFHEAVHYCRMLTYRANIKPNTLPVFYSTAVKIFNEFLNQYE